MKTKPLILLQFAILFFILSCQNVPINDEKQINEVLNEIVEQDTALLDKSYKMVDGFNSANQIRAIEYTKPNYFKDLQPYFLTEDMDFYTNQIHNCKNSKLHKTGVFKELNFISKDSVTQFIAKSEYYGEKGIEHDFYVDFEKTLGRIQEFGLPLFSKNGKYVLVRFYTMTAIPQRQTLFLRIYEKQNNRWAIVKTIYEIDTAKKEK